MVVHIVANEAIKIGTMLQDSLHRRTTKVEIAVFESEFFGGFLAIIVSVDGWGERLVEKS